MLNIRDMTHHMLSTSYTTFAQEYVKMYEPGEKE